MKIPQVLGRDFDNRDVESHRNVMIVNETFARDFFPGENPIGRRVGKAVGIYDWEIVGVVKDSRYSGLREGATRMLYVPYTPGPWASHTVVHVRTAGATSGIAAAIRQVVHKLDKDAPVYNVHTVQEEMDGSLLRERLMGSITGLFGGLALSLAAVGLYGLMAYGVSRRTREFGIRMAVGASAASIVRLVLSEAGWLVAVGVLAGLSAAWAAGRMVSSMLFGIEPTDAVSAMAAVGVLAAAALIAAWIPARRASRVDPYRALRSE
jgi:predicted permease